MTTGPTATADVSRKQLMLEIKLTELRLALLKKEEGATQVQEPIVAPTAIQGKTSMQFDEQASGISSNMFNFDHWLETDRSAQNAVLALGNSEGYNRKAKTIDFGWIAAFKDGMEKFKGVTYVLTDQDKAVVTKLRKKCTSPGWNFERVYRTSFPNRDPLKLFQEIKPTGPLQDGMEIKAHKFPIGARIKLIGRRRNISPLASDDQNLYYIARGSVMCNAIRGKCDCGEGLIKVMVQEIFPHDDPLQKSGEAKDDLSTHVLIADSPQLWQESLLRRMPKENIRSKTKPGTKVSNKGGKENGVRKSTREPKFSSKIVEIINNGAHSRKQTTVGAKRGRKRKGGAPVRTIEASKPVTNVVERPGKRRTTKLALN